MFYKSEYYIILSYLFISYSYYRAYNILRKEKYRGLILSLIYLMIDAGITDISEKQTPLECLSGTTHILLTQLYLITQSV